MLGPDFRCFFQVTMTKQGHDYAPVFSHIYNETLQKQVHGMAWHGMQVKVKVYHISFANAHYRYG